LDDSHLDSLPSARNLVAVPGLSKT
jgi:hypothetical protein